MNANQLANLWQRIWKPVLGVAVGISVIVLLIAVWSVFSNSSEANQTLVYYTVQRSDLPIVVTERGALQSQVETKLRCEVENVSYDRSGSSGTQIIFIVPNGSAVKEGDLLVELDSAVIRDRLDEQELAFERAKSQRIQAQAQYKNQITMNETAEAQARLAVDLARLNLEMYMDDDSGTLKLAKDVVMRDIDEAKNVLLENQASLALQKTQKAGIEALFKLGYKNKSDLDSSRFDYLKAEGRVAQAMNNLSTYQASLRQLESYERQMQELTLQGDVSTAERGLEQVITDNESQLAQAEAARIEAEKAEQKEAERKEKLELQLQRCMIHAPHDGMVVYARESYRRSSSSTEIAEGATVRQRQEIITLPDLSKMQVKTQVHEAVLDQVRPGLPVTVRIDAFPNRVYKGIVDEVAVIASNNYYSSVKTYDCVVRILEEVEQLKPGMTAVAEIHVDRLQDVQSIPVQAVVQIDADTWCYVDAGRGVERRDLVLGRSNDKFVHVESGLSEGDRVVLNPMAILDQNEEEQSMGIAPDANMSETPEIPEDEVEKSKQKASQPKAKKGPRSSPRAKRDS